MLPKGKEQRKKNYRPTNKYNRDYCDIFKDKTDTRRNLEQSYTKTDNFFWFINFGCVGIYIYAQYYNVKYETDIL